MKLVLVRTWMVAIMFLPLAASAAQQAPPPAPPPPYVPKNLQVHPKDIKFDDLRAEMDDIAMGLGVGCDFCHIEKQFPPGATPTPEEIYASFALDDKPAKKTARQMIAMLGTINTMVPAATGKTAQQTVKVKCATCHKGQHIPPQPLQDVLAATAAQKGIPAAVAQYRELRQKYYGSGAYDFSPATILDSTNFLLGPLDMVEFPLVLAGKGDELQAWLAINREFYPNHPFTWGYLSAVASFRKDNAAAIRYLEKAVQLAPNFQPFKDQLAQMKAAPKPGASP